MALSWAYALDVFIFIHKARKRLREDDENKRRERIPLWASALAILNFELRAPFTTTCLVGLSSSSYK